MSTDSLAIITLHPLESLSLNSQCIQMVRSMIFLFFVFQMSIYILMLIGSVLKDALFHFFVDENGDIGSLSIDLIVSRSSCDCVFHSR